ncbi:PREDICTED: F-box/FBD/LRR-repeat protein At1g51370-like [Camelina sativa]|uniref:F-box/FBD/LRR-repeat protein At1g51370-like n=1 Tax=Camelina sativa TaxID=90675 RepID=A0ABM0UL62_CAMSA|nr:PREDICTED: F-box/FBD/LRR-repeat protein At1g51370-like [Camelina sativa]
MVVGRQKKKTKTCEHGKEDLLSQLPEPLISEILCRLSTKDAVRTSLLSTRWRNLWRWVPDLDLESDSFSKSNFDAFVSFVERFLVSHRDRELWIRKLRLCFGYHHHRPICDLTSWIDVLTTCRIQHLDVYCWSNHDIQIPLNLYTCETLVHLLLCYVTLSNAEFVSLPCLKIIHLVDNTYPNETTLQKLISGSPILEDLTITRSWNDDDNATVLQLRSHTLKRVDIDEFTQVVIDAPLLQALKATVSTKNFQIVNLGSSAKLDIDYSGHATCSSSMIHDIITDMSRVRELVIGNAIWKEIFQYSKSEPALLQFRDLSRLNVQFSKSDIELLPLFLESCPKLETLVMELVTDRSMRGKKEQEPKVMFSTVPQCLVSSLKFVQWKRSISGYEGETELVRYFLKNSKIVEKLRLDIYYTEKAKCALLQELLTMPRCSSVCEIHCSVIPRDKYRRTFRFKG